MRAEGLFPTQVASVIAVGSPTPAATAASNHSRKPSSGLSEIFKGPSFCAIDPHNSYWTLICRLASPHFPYLNQSMRNKLGPEFKKIEEMTRHLPTASSAVELGI